MNADEHRWEEERGLTAKNANHAKMAGREMPKEPNVRSIRIRLMGIGNKSFTADEHRYEGIAEGMRTLVEMVDACTRKSVFICVNPWLMSLVSNSGLLD
jgi:hypothetical protein